MNGMEAVVGPNTEPAARCHQSPELAPSVTSWGHAAFPQLRAYRPYHQPCDDTRPWPRPAAKPAA